MERSTWGQWCDPAALNQGCSSNQIKYCDRRWVQWYRMVFIIHCFDHRMNLHKNKAWWIHYLMISVVMIRPIWYTPNIRRETWGWEPTEHCTAMSELTNQRSIFLALTYERPVVDPVMIKIQFTSVWGPSVYSDNDRCQSSLAVSLQPRPLSPKSNWFVYHHCSQFVWDRRHQTPAALVIVPGYRDLVVAVQQTPTLVWSAEEINVQI